MKKMYQNYGFESGCFVKSVFKPGLGVGFLPCVSTQKFIWYFIYDFNQVTSQYRLLFESILVNNFLLLNLFFICYQRYVWWKKSLEVWTKDHPFPIDIDYMISDTLELLRPKIKLCNSLEESIRQVHDLEREFLIKLGKQLIKENEDDIWQIVFRICFILSEFAFVYFLFSVLSVT